VERDWRNWRKNTYLNSLEQINYEEEIDMMINSFMLAHIPLFFLLFWKLSDNDFKEQFIQGLNIFFIIHVGLHLLFLMHKKNEFKDWISWTIISGAGFFGFLDLILS
jgi:hypothetical protein